MAELVRPVTLPPPAPGARPLAAWPPPPRHDPLGVVGLLLWAPFVVVAAGLAVTVWLAPFGIPLLMLTLPPFFACHERRRHRRPSRGLVAVGFVAIGLLDAGAIVLATDAGLDSRVFAGMTALGSWNVAAAIVLRRLRRRRSPSDSIGGEPEALGLWLQVVWLPMVVTLLWPTGLVVGAPLMALALAPCYAGHLRRRDRPIPVWLLLVSSLAVAVWTVPTVYIGFAQDGWLLDLLTLSALLTWIIPAVVTNVLLWRRPNFRVTRRP